MNQKLFKQQLLEQLYAPFTQCTRCPLGTMGRTHVVFGDGNPDAQLMLIGEGPGADEDAQGKPFVGRSGKLLTLIFEQLGISRSSIYITNIVKCRPPQNRKPTEQESSICKNLFLFNQIKVIRPKVICTLGSSAIAGLLGKEVKISQIRGKPIDIFSTIVIPTYHPAFILRNPKELDALINDLTQAVKLSDTTK